MNRTKSTFLALVAVLLSPMSANADLISFDATVATESLVNSTLTLEGTLLSTDSALLPTDLFQTGILNVDFNSAQDFFFAITQDITIDGETQAFTLSGLYSITDAFDTLTLFGGESSLFTTSSGSYVLTALGGEVTANNVGDWEFSVGYNLTQVPEPGTLALLGIGLFGMGLARRRRKV